jgi:hypothetical protein
VAPKDPVAQYLSRHAEPEAGTADRLEGSFGHAVVVPAYGEAQSLFDTLGSIPRGPRGETLVVVVLNARADSPASVHEANRASGARLAEAAKASADLGSEPPISALRYPNGTVVVVDRSGPGRHLPEGQGVGLARKIGNDFVLRLHAAGRIASPWIHNTDADTLLANDAFDQTGALEDAGLAAALYFFEHRFHADPDLALAARLYEISLRYYVLGLAWAESPYAYEAMGSCIAIRPRAYAAVRGFPRKNAAEDFYVLDKLAKVGTIARLSGAPFRLDGRVSDRVPFGTGKALSQLLGRKGALAGFRLYHPAAFAHLGAWLRSIDAVAASGGRLEAALDELPRGNPYFRTELLVASLEKMGAFDALREAIGRSGDAATLRRHAHTWFDAFRTLKLIRALQSGGLPALPWREALAEAPFTGLSASTQDDPETLRRALAAQERQLSASLAGVPAAEGARAESGG